MSLPTIIGRLHIMSLPYIYIYYWEAPANESPNYITGRLQLMSLPYIYIYTTEVPCVVGGRRKI